MSKLQMPPTEALYPLPVVLVSCLDRANSKANIITIAWCGIVCSNPPLISISIRPPRHSYKLIKDTGDFVINVPTRDIVKKADLCGVLSGKDIDKFKQCSFTAVPADKVSSPLIKECPLNMECVVKKTLSLGSHDMFIGQVVRIHADNNITDPSGRIDYGKARPFVFNQGEYWDLGKQIGSYGFSKE